MRRYKRLVVSMMTLSLFLTLVMLLFMPDRIPAHYDAAGEITRLGSKYESLIWPGTVAFFGVFSLLVDKISASLGKKERFVIRTLMVGVLLFFIGMSIFFMAKAIQYGL